MNNQEKNIELIYEKSTLDTNDIQELQELLTDKDVSLYSHQRFYMTNASIDFFVPIILFVTSEAFLVGLASNAAWDVFKTITRFAYNKFHNQKVRKVYSDKTVEETPNIHFDIGNNRFVLPVDIDQEKYEYAVDKFYEYASSHTPNKTTYVWYNKNDGYITTKTEEQIINDEIKKHQ